MSNKPVCWKPANYITENTTEIKNTPIAPTKTQVVFEHYLKKSGTKEKLTDGRSKKIKERLKKFTEDEIKMAINNCFNDYFYNGNNDRGWRADADFVFRSDEVVDRLLNLKPRQDPKEKNMSWEERQVKRLLG